MIVKEISINSKNGLQSKMAAVFIQKASNYKSRIWIEKNERKANAKSLLGLLSLSISDGMKVSLMIDGEDEKKAVDDLEKFLTAGYAEDSDSSHAIG